MAAIQVMTMSGVSAADRTLFFGARMPAEMKKMLPHLKSLDKGLFRKLLQSLEFLECVANVSVDL